MTQPQVPLQLNTKGTCQFEDFIGSKEVVDSLLHYQHLPLLTYLWGSAFAGKSFLLSALCNHLQKNNQKVALVAAMNILDHGLIEYLLTDYDFLLVEDISQLSGNLAYETALFNLYNACQSQKVKLVVTAECSQRDALWQLPDLRSRLSSGLVLSLEVLKGDDALLCIKQLFSQSGMPLEDAVINYLKTTQNTSLSNLYPLFKQLTIDTLKLKRKVTIPMIKQALLNIQESET